jgi:hypothetical protein
VSTDSAEEIAAADATLVDMVRSGDFVEAIRLAGHHQATMRTVPVSWPVLRPAEGGEPSPGETF